MTAVQGSFVGCTYDYSGLGGAQGSGGNVGRGTGGASVGSTGGTIGGSTGGNIGLPGEPVVTGMGARPGGGSGGLSAAVGGGGGKGDLGGNGATGTSPGMGGSSSNGGGAGPIGGQGGSVGAGGNGAVGGNGGNIGNIGLPGADGLNADPDLVVWYTFDESAGMVAADTSGAAGGPRNGMLVTQGMGGAVAFSASHRVGTHALSLTANGTAGGGYANIPVLGQLAPQAMTVSAWVNISAHNPGQRVFECAASTDVLMALTTTDNNALPRFGIATRGVANDQLILGTTKLSTGDWHHLVVVLAGGSPYTGQLYIDGVVAGRNTAMSFHPGDLGATKGNYLGRSVSASVPFLPGLIDDFRVYRRALTTAEITTLFGGRVPSI